LASNLAALKFSLQPLETFTLEERGGQTYFKDFPDWKSGAEAFNNLIGSVSVRENAVCGTLPKLAQLRDNEVHDAVDSICKALQAGTSSASVTAGQTVVIVARAILEGHLMDHAESVVQYKVESLK